MNTKLQLLVISVVLCFSGFAGAQEYVGSEACSACHPEEFNNWRASGHPYKLVPIEDAAVRPIPLPEGYTFNDISYVIGGYKWKSRYIDNNGYIITSIIDDYGEGDVVPGQNQYNYMTGTWSDYHPGEVDKPYNCGACHTTGWVADEDHATDGDLSDNQDGMPGMHGTFAFGGIHCEGCHGPGEDMEIKPDAVSCGSCHVRGDPDTIPASGGFIRHHEQWNELRASRHELFGCSTCHEPHTRAEFSIQYTCEDCHNRQKVAYEGTPMQVNGVECIDCHMPFATKSAQKLGPFEGDLKTHLFSINTAADANLFTEDGKFVLLDDEGKAGATLDFACQRCHRDRTLDWLSMKAKNFHEPEMQAVAINAGFNDSWYSPNAAGQGFTITVYPDKGQMFVSWFTYDGETAPLSSKSDLGDPGHRWLTAQGAFADHQAVLDITMTKGGEFASNAPVTNIGDGTLIVEFSDCENGTITYNIDSMGKQGVMPIKRLSMDNVSLCKAL
jgi:hypothetical protein